MRPSVGSVLLSLKHAVTSCVTAMGLQHVFLFILLRVITWSLEGLKRLTRRWEMVERPAGLSRLRPMSIILLFNFILLFTVVYM